MAAGDEFDVAVSFADEDRAYVERVVRELQRLGVRVFYDADHGVELWGRDLATEFDEVFRHRSRLVVIFISEHYVRKPWTRHELRSVLARALRERDVYLLPARIDDADLPGLPDTVRHIDCREATPEQLAAMVHEKVGPPGDPATAAPAGTEPPVFSARVDEPSGSMTVGFGAAGTVVVVERSAAVHRWNLADGTSLRGVARGESLRYGLRFDRHGVVSTARPAVALVRDRMVTLVHFEGAGPRAIQCPLQKGEYVVPVGGRAFATYTGRRIAVRDFEDGGVRWEQPCPPGLMSVTLAAAGDMVAAASSNRLTVVARDDGRPRCFTFENLPGAGCNLAFSPRGDLLACVSFREVMVVRPKTEEVVERRRLTWTEASRFVGFGWFRALCLPDGEVLWLLRGRIARIRWPAADFLWLQQAGSCDDLALDPTGSLLATVNRSGLVQVLRLDD